MTIGYSTMSIVGTIPCEKINCLIFLSTAKSTSIINTVFPVDDRITSFWNPVLKQPIWAEKNLNEGKFHKKYEVTFDHKANKAEWKLDQISGNSKKLGILNKEAKWKYKKGTTENLPNNFQDILSAVYFMRSYNAKRDIGKYYEINLFDDLKISILKMKILKLEKLNLNVNGEQKNYPALLTKPFFQTSGIFRSAGDILIWISDDSRRIPLKIQANIPYVGNIIVELIEDNSIK